MKSADQNTLVAQLAKRGAEELSVATGPTGSDTGKTVAPSSWIRFPEKQRGKERPGEIWEAVGSNPAQRAIAGVAQLAEPGRSNSSVDAGSSPEPRAISKIRAFQFRWREPLGRSECPYAYRWVLNLGLFSVRVHQWIRSDDKRYFHDHPWHFVTLILRGTYTDVTESGRDKLSVGSVRFRSAGHRHYVDVPASGALSLLLTTAKVREWGFWVKGAFKRPLRYFGKFGHPPCDEQ